jgi:small subunit ribosomal protein S4
MGFARSRNQARQMVLHGHFTVNGRRVNIPSYLLKQGDTVSVIEKSRKVPAIVEAIEAVDRRGVPEWLMLEKEKFEAKVMAYPTREQLTLPIQEQLIVELYSK